MRTSATINQVITEWLRDLDVMPTTKASYRTKVGLWFRYLSRRGLDVRTPKRSDLLDYKSALEEEGKTALTVDGYVTAVRLFYKYCASRGYYDNLGSGIRSSVRYRGHRKGRLSADESGRLLRSIDTRTLIGKRDKLMLALMLMLALRTCEVERIDIGDFDAEDGVDVLRIQRKGRHEKVEALAVPASVMELYADYIAERGFELSDPLFVNHDRRPQRRLLRTSISEIVHVRLAAIGIQRPDITAHSLRHTCACLMVEAGVDLEKVRDMLGHTSTSTTRIYAEEMHARMLIRNSPSVLVEKAIEGYVCER